MTEHNKGAKVIRIPYRMMWRLLEMHLLARYDKDKTWGDQETGQQRDIRIRINEAVRVVREIAPGDTKMHELYWNAFRDDYLTLLPNDPWMQWTRNEMLKIERIAERK